MPAKKKVRPIGDEEAAELDKEIDELDGGALGEDDPDEDTLTEDEDEDADEDDAWGASDDSEEEEV